jgi:hypothetical protein
MAHFRTTPEPGSMTGTYDTSDTAGPDAAHTELRGVTRAFDEAEARDLAWAVRGLDPNDPAVDPSVVQTSSGLTVNRGDPDADADRVRAKAQRALDGLATSGLELGPTGRVRTRDHSQPAQNLAASIGPMTTVDDDNEDRSAG